jgi:putative transposase
MHLVEKYIIKPSNLLYSILDELCFKSKNLYNKANYIVRQNFVNNNTYIDYIKLQKMLQNTNDKDYRSLPVCCAQQTLKLLDKNWKSFFKSNKDYKNNKNKYNGAPKPPKYKQME